MCAQRIRSVIIYSAVNLDLPKETDGLGLRLQEQVSRIHAGKRFGTISEEVLEPVLSMRYSHCVCVSVCVHVQVQKDSHA